MLEDEIKMFLAKHACERFENTDTVQSIMRKWHEPYGVEFCRNTHYPDIELIRKYKTEFEKYNVFVDRNDIEIENEDVILFNCVATLNYKLPVKRYSVILYSNNVVTISAREFAFVVCNKINETNTLVVDSDEKSVITIQSK
jgi:hypothetical protein